MLPDKAIGCFMTSSGLLQPGNLLKPSRFHLIFVRFPTFLPMREIHSEGAFFFYFCKPAKIDVDKDLQDIFSETRMI